jgi:Tfp pilus assembly protein PilV
MLQTKPHGHRGVALIEALVALTVTALGVVAVLGIQSVLRQNADIAKQRSEAVRLAQEEIERWRSFDPVTRVAGTVTYDDLDTGPAGNVDGSNTTFAVSREVRESFEPVFKALAVRVDWTDRTGQAQRVVLNTTVGGIAPELAATVVVPADGGPVARPGGRHGGIPLGAKRLSPTQSAFRPPQDTGLARSTIWLFDHLTGLITVCESTATSTQQITLDNYENCQSLRFQLLSGFVRFALPADAGGTPIQPTAEDAANPRSSAEPAQVLVRRTSPSPTTDVSCFSERRSTFVSYFCAIPVSPLAAEQPRWSGRAMVTGLPNLTADPANASPDDLRVCRYTRYADDRTVGNGPDNIKNSEHPLDYLNVDGPLSNQNFLLIRAGNGSLPFTCPLDDPSTPLNTTTFAHPLP